MASNRAEDRKFHYTYKVTCANNGKVFYGLNSTDDLEDGFQGAGKALYESKKHNDISSYTFELLALFPTRKEAKAAYTELKASELVNPKKPGEYTFHYVYKITRFDGKYYIGVHSTNNLKTDKYMGSGTYINRSLRKHGKDKHIKEILEFLPSRAAAFAREAELVTEDTLKDPLCMNHQKGGNEHKEVYGFTAERLAKISEHFKTIERTPEWKAKISEAHKGKTVDPEVGRRHSEKMKGRKHSPEVVAKRVEGQLNSEKFKERYRPIVVDGVTYQNGREAVEALGIAGSTLANRLNSPNWLNYRYADQPEKDPALVSKRARGEYTRD